MPPNAPPPLSAPWWLGRLEPRLYERQKEMRLAENYYDGEHPFPFVTETHRDKMVTEFQRMLKESQSNFCELVVDVVAERLQVEGFRLSAETDETADAGAWEIWQANQMDAEAPTAILDALIKGVSYLSVWSGARPNDPPIIAVEDPCETIVAYTPGTNCRQRDAALKIWRDDVAGVMRANVYLRDGIYKFYATKETTDGGTAYAQSISESKPDNRWLPFSDAERFVPNPRGVNVVPIVPLRNRPRVQMEGRSELVATIPIQNQINGFLFLLALAGYFGAHRQRWAAGIKIMIDQETGKPQMPFDIAVDRMVFDTDPNTKFGDFAATDLSGYIKAIEQKVGHISVITKTPRHYLLQEGQSPSGDAIRSAESGLVRKAEGKMRPLGEGFEEAIRIARLVKGERDAPVDSEIVWANAATPTEAETTDATIKKFGAGLITIEQAQEDLGYTATQIRRMATQRASDQLFQALTNPPTETASPVLIGANGA